MKFKKFLPLIGMLLFAYIFSKLDLGALYDVFRTANYAYVMVAFLSMVLLMGVQTLKWKVLLDAQDIKVRFGKLLQFNLIGQFYGVITPGKIGNFLRINYLSAHTGKSVGECSTSVVIDRALDTFVLFSLALYGSFLVAGNLTWAVFVIFCLLFVGAWVLWDKKRSFFALRLFFKYAIPKRLRDLAKKSFHEFHDELPKLRRVLPRALALNIATWLLVYSIVYMITWAFYPGLEYYFVVGAWAIATVVGLIPVTVSGFGTREATLISLFSLKGVPPEVMVSMSLTAYFVSTIFVGAIGGVLALKEDGGKKDEQIHEVRQRD